MPWTNLPAQCRKTLWRGSPIIEEIKNAVADSRCGSLCSLRFSWMRPAKNSCTPSDFTGDLLESAKDAAKFIAASGIISVTLRQVPGENNLFGLITLQNGVIVELEINETLPNSLPDTFFAKANFSCGHLTNQPLTGFFNTEGMIVADASNIFCLIAENPEQQPVNGIIGQMIQRRLDLFNADIRGGN